MEFTITARYGSLNIEIEGGDREEMQDELLDLAEFLEENNGDLEVFRGTQPTEQSPSSSTQTEATEWDEQPQAENGEALFESISERTHIDVDVLGQLFEVPDDEEEVPFVKLFQFDDGAEVLGNHRNQRQAYGSLLVLYLWQECRGIDEVELETLNNALSYSDIDIERRDAMYQAFSSDAQNWFDSNGSTISLTTRGEHQAREVIGELAEEFE